MNKIGDVTMYIAVSSGQILEPVLIRYVVFPQSTKSGIYTVLELKDKTRSGASLSSTEVFQRFGVTG